MAAVVGARTVLRETLGAKLRRLARAAEGNNPLDRPPLRAAAAWQPSTAYKLGQAVRNGGRTYVCCTNGISASSGGPAASTTGDATSDGTSAWTLLGGLDAIADDPFAPTLTISGADPGGISWQPAPSANNYRLYGAYPVGGGDWVPTVFSNSGSTVAKGRGSAVGFVTDAPVVTIVYASDSPGLSFSIDGRFFQTGATPITSGTQYLTLDFTAAGGRRERSVRIYGGKDDGNFRGVKLGAADYLVAPPTADDVRVAAIGDSIWAGSNYGPFLPGRTVPTILGMLLGWSDVWNFTEGGTGLNASAGGTKYTFGQRVAEARSRSPDLWLVGATGNDKGDSAAMIQAAAVTLLQAIRAGSSTAPVIVSGIPMSRIAGDYSSILAAETAWAAAVAQFADPGVSFIPVTSDPAMPWITGTWSNGVKSGLANAASLIGGDNVHPVDAGTHALARRLAREIRTRVLPALR